MKRQILLNNHFVCTATTPLISEDDNAYEIIHNFGISRAGDILKIIAKRADGLVVDDICTIDKDGGCTYTLKSKMHAIPGTLEITLQICKDGSILTYKVLRFDVINLKRGN